MGIVSVLLLSSTLSNSRCKMRGAKGAFAITIIALAVFACVLVSREEDAAGDVTTVMAEVDKKAAHKVHVHKAMKKHFGGWNPSRDSKGVARAASRAAKAARAVARAAQASSEKTSKYASVINSALRKAEAFEKRNKKRAAKYKRAAKHALKATAAQRKAKHAMLAKVRAESAKAHAALREV